MMGGYPGLRSTCPDCLRAACICAAWRRPGVPVASAVELLVLQHPREQRALKGSARLLHLAVQGSTLLAGEAWGTAPPAAADPQRLSLLLYPATPGDAHLPPPPAWPQPLPPPQALRLVVLDATWRKSRRMLYDSPWLQGLPRLGLVAPPPSRYHVRRARGDAQRSTFEAAVLALAQLNGPAWPAERLWPVFDAFVDQLSAAAAVGAVRPSPATRPGRGR